MADEAAVTDAGASAAPVDSGAAASSATPTETPVDTSAQVADGTQQAEQPSFDASLFEGQETEQPPVQQPDKYADLLALSPYIRDEQTLQNAIERQSQVEAVLQGAQPTSALFEPMRQQNPQQWSQLMNGIADYLQQATGMKFVDPAQAGGQQLSPEQQRIQALEQEHQQYRQQQQQERQQQAVNQAQKQLMEALPELTKGRFIEGEKPEWIMQQLGSRLAGKESQVMQAIARGDMTMVKNAIAQISHEERLMFNARGKRVAQQRTSLRNAVPKTTGKGAPDLVLPDGKIDTKSPDWFGKVATKIMTQ